MITPWFLPDSGGVERHVLEVGRRLVDRGIPVTVAAADNTRTRPAVAEIEGIAVRRVPAWPRGRDYLFAPGLYRVAVEPEWDLIHIQSWHTAVPPLAMFAATRAGTPYLVTPHGGNTNRLRVPFRPAQRRLLGPLLRGAEGVVALNPSQRDTLSQQYRLQPDRIHVIPNGSDLAHPAPGAVARVRADFGNPILVSPGRLERFKGHHRAIEALPHLLESHPDATLRLLGKGPYESELLTLASNLGVADRVHVEFFSQDQRAELAAALEAANVGVLFSEYETQPVAVLELLALGVPAVVTDAPGLRELAADGLARSIPLDAPPEDVARAIVQTLEEPRPAPRSLPSWEAVTDQLLELYQDVLRQRRPT